MITRLTRTGYFKKIFEEISKRKCKKVSRNEMVLFMDYEKTSNRHIHIFSLCLSLSLSPLLWQTCIHTVHCLYWGDYILTKYNFAHEDKFVFKVLLNSLLLLQNIYSIKNKLSTGDKHMLSWHFFKKNKDSTKARILNSLHHVACCIVSWLFFSGLGAAFTRCNQPIGQQFVTPALKEGKV